MAQHSVTELRRTPGPDPCLQRLIASLLVVRGTGHLLDAQRRYPQWELSNRELQDLLELGVGGVILLGGSAAEVRLRTHQLRQWAQQPLLLCADVEEGVGQRFEGASWLPPPLSLGRLYGRDPERALGLARRYGECTGREARAIGLNWVLGPVCDVNNNPANPVINVRAWGETPAVAAELARAFYQGLQAQGVLGCAKHFPGHGDTSVDSHLELPLLPHGLERLEAVELPPFAALIEAGIEAVMSAHVVLSTLDQERPATLSRAVLTGLLRQQLGFAGLVVTDALVMEAISGHYGAAEAAVLALEAGADLVLMPADARDAIDAIATAVHSGRLTRAQLQTSAARRSQALARTYQPQVITEAWRELAEPDTDLVNAMLQATLEHQGGPMTPEANLKTGQPQRPTGINLIRLENSLQAPQAVPQLPALTLPASRGWRALLLEPRSPSPWSGDREQPLALDRLGAGPVLLQLFVRGNPFSGSAAAQEPWPQVISQLQRAGQLAGLVVYGSPYLWEQLHPLLQPQIPAAYSAAQMPQAQIAALDALGLGDSLSSAGFTD
ncbi:MAG: glycoside hydrolase family 3 N-terminal domain-containing protein [Cyanobacteriota bacterium]|nr:glycoside hydrolase family 3 N-terminal domain-containing protein [Cyanobacteriota bacterium]